MRKKGVYNIKDFYLISFRLFFKAVPGERNERQHGFNNWISGNIPEKVERVKNISV